MDFRLLGLPDVAVLLHASDVVSTERLIDEPWGESPPATVAKSVRTYVLRLRKEFSGERLMTRPPRYVFGVGPGEVAPDGRRTRLGWSLTGAGA
jgi:hypothetical protein